MPKFCISTLGCKVNFYETEQIAALLRSRGWTRTQELEEADLRIINTCSVTVQAASKSRQAVRQVVSLPVLSSVLARTSEAAREAPTRLSEADSRPRVVVTGCWATSNPEEASRLGGVSAVLTHHDDLATELDRLLLTWRKDVEPSHLGPASTCGASGIDEPNKTKTPAEVKEKSANQGILLSFAQPPTASNPVGTPGLPMLDEHQDSHQRGFMKVQDGCDANCTYCIIPQLRPRLWSKPVDDAVEEARRLVASGHLELVLTGIFLGAYGQATALRRRQAGGRAPLGELVAALCTRVPGLRRIRLSSLEPGDLSEDLLKVLQSHEQVVPHFHLPLQSGCDAILRRMNRQYRRDDFLRMAGRVHEAFDRPAITTDIIVAFPGEGEEEFAQTLEVVDRTGFIHIHAFAFSPRPGTAAAKWKRSEQAQGKARIERLRRRAAEHSVRFRSQFVDEMVEVMVEREGDLPTSLRQGRCERYFAVHFESERDLTGKCVRVRIDRVSATRTHGTLIEEVGGGA